MEKVKELYHRYKFIVWPVCTGLSAVIILGFIVIPQLITYLNFKNELASIYKKSAVLEVKAQDLEQIDQVATKQKLDTVFTILPMEQNVPEAMLTIQSIVNKSGLVLKNTAYSAGKKVSGPNSFLLNVTVLGTVNSVRAFLLNLKDSPRVFQVDSIAVQFQKGGSFVEATLPISVFYQPANQVTASLDQPIPVLDPQEEQLLTNLSKLAPLSIGNLLQSTSSAVLLGKGDPFE